MAGDDAELARSAPGNLDGTQDGTTRGRRQRAADLFSPHRYRALQISAFERRGARAATPEEPVVLPYAGEDDAVDPPLDSATPAALAARADVPGVDGVHHDPLSPVPDEEASPFAPASHPWPDAEDTADLGLPDERYAIPAEGQPWTPEGGVGGAQQWPGAHWPQEQWEGEEPATDDAVASADEAPAAPRSGRNMPVATAVGVALLAVAVGASWVNSLVFALVLYAFTIGALIEWKRALALHGRRIPLIPLVAATVGMGVSTWYAKPEGLVVALLVGCAGVVAWRIGDERVENTLADALAGVLTLLWIPFLASFLLLLELADDGWMRVIVVVLAVVGNDTGGLLTGMFLGKHKLLERVSPKKTWEGAIGGALTGTLAATIAAYFFFDGDWHIGAAVGLACTVAAVVGDLAESALKRDIHIKDMSSAIPGHGGILDRMDSILFAAPIGYVVFAIFLGTLGGGGL